VATSPTWSIRGVCIPRPVTSVARCTVSGLARPALKKSQPLLMHSNLRALLRENRHIHRDRNAWHDTVKKAVLERAQSWYDTSAHRERLPNFQFVYRGRQYLREDSLCELAPTAIQARADRLPGVPNAWEHQQCPFCENENGMNGAHLLQCGSLPGSLLIARDQLRSSMSTRAFAMQVIGCKPCDLVVKGLHLAQKVFKAARRSVQGPASPPSLSQSDVAGEEFNT
jgi:hypothetical protein